MSEASINKRLKKKYIYIYMRFGEVRLGWFKMLYINVDISQKLPLDMSKWGLKIVLFISNMYAGFLSYRAGSVITR